ncbi:TRBP2 protein, partial [Bucorvus abyssinicus]|nr:TRBP2 protein [Bucorvus abyssinicus]
SLEQMLAANPGKTPISLLQEYGTRIGKTPGYDLLKAEGQAHQPNFTFRVTVGDISCTGGSPRTSWDHQFGLGPPVWAATSSTTAGNSWRGSQLGWGDTNMSPREGFGGPAPPPSPPHSCPRPQELVVQKGWRLPEYTVTQESGPAHRKEFTMTCRVERFVEIGGGRGAPLGAGCPCVGLWVVPWWGSGQSPCPCGGVRRVHSTPSPSPQAGPRLEGLRGRTPGCTWDSLRNSAGEKMVQLR